MVQRIAAATPHPNPAAMQTLATQVIDNWELRPGGLRLAKVGDYWIKEVADDARGFTAYYGKGALDAQVDGLGRLGQMAPEHLFENGRLIIRDVGKFEGPLSEFLEIKLAGSLRLGNVFNDIWYRNVGANGQIFDPSLHPLHQALYYVLAAAGISYGGLEAWIASQE